MAYGGTLEKLATNITVTNSYGGNDTITHRAWGMHVDPFSSLLNPMVQVVMYHGKPAPTGTTGKGFLVYPGIEVQTATFTPDEVKDLEAQNKYSFQGFVDAAKVKLGVT